MRWEARLALPALARHARDEALREKMSYRASLCADAPWSRVMRMHCADQFAIDFERECDGGGNTESFKRGRLFVLNANTGPCAGVTDRCALGPSWITALDPVDPLGAEPDSIGLPGSVNASTATVGADGGPQVTPVWFDWDGTHLRFNTAKGRVKDRNMRRTPKVALAIMDPDNPYRYLQIKGRIVENTESGADAHIDSLAKKYMGVDKYPHRKPGEVRVIYKVAPDRVQTMG